MLNVEKRKKKNKSQSVEAVFEKEMKQRASKGKAFNIHMQPQWVHTNDINDTISCASDAYLMSQQLACMYV